MSVFYLGLALGSTGILLLIYLKGKCKACMTKYCCKIF